MAETYDVIVAGSGSAGMIAAVRAKELGLSVLVIEKAAKWGGTSATSGGVIWIPNHGLGTDDSREQALRYINDVKGEGTRPERIEAFVDQGRDMVAYLGSLGMHPTVMPWPDYFPSADGARADRSIVFPMYDGRRLGDNFTTLREQFTRFKLFNRYSMDFGEAFIISMQSKGWKRTFAKVVSRYWADFSTRGLTKRDRQLSLGASLIGRLGEILFKRGVEIRLDTRVNKLLTQDGRVTGVRVNRFGREYEVHARHGVVVCAGGFEWNQRLREQYLTIPGEVKWSTSPRDANMGEVMEAGTAIGAATEFTETGWMLPSMVIPIEGISNFEEIHQCTFDVGRPHSVCVNRNGDRFVDEACGYDRFGNAMLQDNQKTGANAPCWHIFDARFRHKFTCGGLMPSQIQPDSNIPVDWWDHYLFKADTIAELAAKIDLDPAKLEKVVAQMNSYADTGVDPEFGRGNDIYDRNFGDPRVGPNPCLGRIEKAPYYAVPMNLGDLGTKGGLKCDAKARVLDGNDQPIVGLYAAGNASGTPFGNAYPGAGGTIGPAMVFGFVAVNDIAERAKAGELGSYTHNQPHAA